MIMIIFIILIFVLGFCFGNLYQLKNIEKLNDSWCLLAQKVNKDWLDITIKNKTVWQYEANCTNVEEDELLDSIDFEFDDIGKTVFLTKEEAEEKLR